MRDQWYGDKRDVVKWATLVHLAQSLGIRHILQVAYLRPSKLPATLKTRDGSARIPVAVLDHFRSINAIAHLAHETDLCIDVMDDPFETSAECPRRADVGREYTERVVRKLRSCDGWPVIVFLDPDTGIAVSKAAFEHVAADETRAIYDALKPGDVLVLYQHAHRKPDWRVRTRRAFAAAIGLPERHIATFTCPELTNDVAFFVAEKAGA